jgi:hypothetical protein
MGMKDRFYVGTPFRRKPRQGQTRDVVALRAYLKALGGVLENTYVSRRERKKVSTNARPAQ